MLYNQTNNPTFMKFRDFSLFSLRHILNYGAGGVWKIYCFHRTLVFLWRKIVPAWGFVLGDFLLTLACSTINFHKNPVLKIAKNPRKSRVIKSKLSLELNSRNLYLFIIFLADRSIWRNVWTSSLSRNLLVLVKKCDNFSFPFYFFIYVWDIIFSFSSASDCSREKVS